MVAFRSSKVEFNAKPRGCEAEKHDRGKSDMSKNEVEAAVVVCCSSREYKSEKNFTKQYRQLVLV